jgi:NADH:ubiquinone oxidoreductase subunit 6 (subunit J)
VLSSLLCIFASIWFVSFGRPVLLNKVLLLITIYFFGAIFLAQFHLYFVAFSYIIVYIGAIAILFLFIIMICDSSTPSSAFSPTYGLFLIPFLLIINESKSTSLAVIWNSNYFKTTFELFDINSLSIVMFNGWPFIIILVGILLTSCLIGILQTLGR